jgi:hypothetical protein
MTDFRDNTDFDKCLCCGQAVTKPGDPMTPERAVRAYAFLAGLGYERADLLGKHRAQLQYQSPGLVEWIEALNDGGAVSVKRKPKAAVPLKSVTIERLIEEVRLSKEAPPSGYNRVYNRHMRS